MSWLLYIFSKNAFLLLAASSILRVRSLYGNALYFTYHAADEIGFTLPDMPSFMMPHLYLMIYFVSI